MFNALNLYLVRGGFVSVEFVARKLFIFTNVRSAKLIVIRFKNLVNHYCQRDRKLKYISPFAMALAQIIRTQITTELCSQNEE